MRHATPVCDHGLVTTPSTRQNAETRTSLEPLDINAIDAHVPPQILVLVEDLETAPGALFGRLDLGL